MKKYEEMLDVSLLEHLRIDGIKFVRWAYAGSNDQGGIVEIKLYDSDEVAVAEIDVYGGELVGTSRNSRVLKMGFDLLEESRGGFEINDGGYGWILLNTKSGELWASEKHNWRGMESEYFDSDGFDRLELSLNEDWQDTDTMIDALDVAIHFKRKAKGKMKHAPDPIYLTEDEKKKFMTVNWPQEKVTREDFIAARVGILCRVNGTQLRSHMEELGISSAERYYFWLHGSDYQFSKSAEDNLVDLKFEVMCHDERFGTIFIGGWAARFDYDVMYESQVIERNPGLDELTSGKL